MKALEVEIFNLIPVLSGTARILGPITGPADKIMRRVRESCQDPGSSLESWARTIERHLPIPPTHPFHRILAGIAPGDPLRTLGAWAYGSEKEWITIEKITWADQSVTYPQAEHRAWIQRSFATTGR